MTAAFVLVLAILVLVNVWVHLGPAAGAPRHRPGGGAGAAGGRASWRGCPGPSSAWPATTCCPACSTGWQPPARSPSSTPSGVAVPVTRRAFHDTRYRVPMRSAVLMSLVTIPLGTVVFEEVAFRSVLWGMLEHERGAAVATVVSSALFGLWHVLPALDVAQHQHGDPGQRSVRTVAGCS